MIRRAPSPVGLCRLQTKGASACLTGVAAVSLLSAKNKPPEPVTIFHPHQDLANAIAAWSYAVLSVTRENLALRNCIGIERKASQTKTASMKEIAANLQKKNWLHQVAGDAEAILCPDFWHKMPAPGKSRDAFWEAIDQCPRVHVIIPSLIPEQYIKALPPYFAERPYPNVHLLAVLGDSPDENAQRIAALLKTPARSRGLWVDESLDPSQLGMKPTGIDFVIIRRLACGDERALLLPADSLHHWQVWCAENGIAFVPIPPISHGENPGDVPLELPYPFPMVEPMGECLPIEATPGTFTQVEPSALGCDPGEILSMRKPRLVNRKVRGKTGRTRRKPRPSRKRADAAGAAASDAVVACEVTVVNAAEVIASDGREGPTALTPDGRESAKKHFLRLDSVVRTGMRASIDAAFAFMEIRARELWREGGYASWNKYCETILEVSRSYINRLISHATISRGLLENSPPVGEDGNPILPAGESLSRPLKKIKCAKTRATAWRQAVEAADGMPTARIVVEAVANFVERKTAGIKPPPLPVRRRELVRKLRALAEHREDWDSILTLVSELEKIS